MAYQHPFHFLIPMWLECLRRPGGVQTLRGVDCRMVDQFSSTGEKLGRPARVGDPPATANGVAEDQIDSSSTTGKHSARGR